MPDPSTYRPAAGSIPVSPGVYRFKDTKGRVIYVGKAKNLRARLSSYFQDLAIVQRLLAAGADPELGPRSAVEIARFFDLPDLLTVLQGS